MTGFRHLLGWYLRIQPSSLPVFEWVALGTHPGQACVSATPGPNLSLAFCTPSNVALLFSKPPCPRSKMSTSLTSIQELYFQCHFLSSTLSTGCSMWYEGPVSPLGFDNRVKIVLKLQDCPIVNFVRVKFSSTEVKLMLIVSGTLLI